MNIQNYNKNNINLIFEDKQYIMNVVDDENYKKKGESYGLYGL